MCNEIPFGFSVYLERCYKFIFTKHKTAKMLADSVKSTDIPLREPLSVEVLSGQAHCGTLDGVYPSEDHR